MTYNLFRMWGSYMGALIGMLIVIYIAPVILNTGYLCLEMQEGYLVSGEQVVIRSRCILDFIDDSHSPQFSEPNDYPLRLTSTTIIGLVGGFLIGGGTHSLVRYIRR